MSLRDWYADREILLTGVTSEVGRACLEKILRLFPRVKVYTILRSRNGLSRDDRMKKIFTSPGYERLRQEAPNAILRVKALEGNLLYDGLGLSKEDRASLMNVTVVFHASGPHEAVFEFCQEYLPKLCAVSATSNLFRHKGQLTESLQNEHVPEIPLALVRVPFVGPALRDPMPGFVEVLKPATALMVGTGFALGNPELPAEIVPVDRIVNILIAAAWERALVRKTDAPLVYNVPTIGCTWGELIQKSGRASRRFPFPTFKVRGMTSNPTLYWIVILFFEWLPSVLSDTILSVFNRKQRILAEHERVRNALRSLESISTRPWSAERNRVYLLQKRLSQEDQDVFPVCGEIDVESYVLCSAAATRKYCTDESKLNVIWIFNKLFLILLAAIFAFFFFSYTNFYTFGSDVTLNNVVDEIK